MMEQDQDPQFGRELILNTIAVEAGRKIQWEQYAAHLMAEYGITQADVEEYINKHGPLIKPLLLGLTVTERHNPAVKDAIQFRRQIKEAKNISAAEQTIRLARTWDQKQGAIPGPSELILRFARTNNPIEKFIYFFRLMFKFIRAGKPKEMTSIKQEMNKKFSYDLYGKLITLGLMLATVYSVFPCLPGIVFRQSITNALKFTLYWGIFTYLILPILLLFMAAVLLVDLWRQDKETRKITISKWKDRFAGMKWFPPVLGFLSTMCVIMFMHFQHASVFHGQSWDGLFLAGGVLWILQMLLYFIFRKISTQAK